MPFRFSRLFQKIRSFINFLELSPFARLSCTQQMLILSSYYYFSIEFLLFHRIKQKERIGLRKVLFKMPYLVNLSVKFFTYKVVISIFSF